MTGRRGIIGLCLLCALAFSAFAAQSASAAEAGTTAFTCKKKAVEGGTGFSREHCKAADAVSSGAKYEHVAIAQGTTTQVIGSNDTTEGTTDSATFETVQIGVPLVIHAGVVTATGTMENKFNATTKEHFIHGKGKIEYTNLEVTPAELKCVVKGNKVVTNELTASSEGLAMGAGKKMHLKVQPTPGISVIAEFTLEGCTLSMLNGLYKVEGSVTSDEIDGATINTTSSTVTAEETLKTRARKAGITGTLTIKGKDEAAGDLVYTPLSATTVET